MIAGPESIAAELGRYRDMLAPLLEVPASGNVELPPEERRACEHGIATVLSYHGDHLELEEAVAAFARALWAAPGAAEPRAWIALGLMARARHWPEAEREQVRKLARGFAERAFATDPGGVASRTAWSRALLWEGLVADAERIASFLPETEALALALRSEVAEKKGDLATAVQLKQLQLARETDALALRVTRNKLGLLLQAAGRLEEAAAVHETNLTRHPDYAWGRVNLASVHEASGNLLDAFAEAESAVVLGLADAAPYLEQLGQQLDRDSLARFHRSLRTGRDGETVDLTPAPAGAR